MSTDITEITHLALSKPEPSSLEASRLLRGFILLGRKGLGFEFLLGSVGTSTSYFAVLAIPQAIATSLRRISVNLDLSQPLKCRVPNASLALFMRGHL